MHLQQTEQMKRQDFPISLFIWNVHFSTTISIIVQLQMHRSCIHPAWKFVCLSEYTVSLDYRFAVRLCVYLLCNSVLVAVLDLCAHTAHSVPNSVATGIFPNDIWQMIEVSHRYFITRARARVTNILYWNGYLRKIDIFSWIIQRAMLSTLNIYYLFSK